MTLGETGVGKTCLLVQFVENTFLEGCFTQISTIGIDCRKKMIQVNGEDIAVTIWDTAGQERYHCITSAYYRGMHGIILVYDVTNRKSFLQIEKWVKDIRSKTNCADAAVLVANKVDLGEKRSVSTEEGKRLATRHQLAFIETSAKTGENVAKAFDTAVALCLTRRQNTPQMQIQQTTEVVRIIEPEQKPKFLCGLGPC